MFRKANENDIDRIAEIYEEIHTQEETGLASIGWARGVYPTRQTAIDSVKLGDMFVYENDEGLVVAAGKINKEQVDVYYNVPWSVKVPDEKVMVLHTLVVSPGAGRNGYGAKFVDFYESYALEQGCPYLRIDTNEKNVRARAMYKKLGYTEMSIEPCVFNGIEGVPLVCMEKTMV